MISKVPEFGNHINIHTPFTIVRLLLNPKGGNVYGLNSNNQVLLLNEKKYEVITEVQNEVLSWFITCNGTKLCIVFKPDSSVTLNILFIDLYGSRLTQKVSYKTDSVTTSALISDDGAYIIIGEAYKVTIHDLIGGTKHSFISHTCEVISLATDKKTLFAGDRTGIIKSYEFNKKFLETGQFTDDNHGPVTLIIPKISLKLLFSASEERYLLV